MANITVRELQELLDKQTDWLSLNESPARECLVIEFSRSTSPVVIGGEFVNKTLYLQSNDGSVSIDFDSTGQVIRVEIV